MSFRNLMIIKALVCLVFGVVLMAIPGELISLFGPILCTGGMFTAREYSASLFGNLFLTWIAKDSGESDARKAIIMALFVYDLIGFIVTFVLILIGILNALAWLIAFIYLFFTVGFGYFWIKPPEPKTA
jgi:hypothetical protein